MPGFPVTIVESGGAPFVAVASGAPLATVADMGIPITLVERGAPPLIVGGMAPAGTQFFAGVDANGDTHEIIGVMPDGTDAKIAGATS